MADSNAAVSGSEDNHESSSQGERTLTPDSSGSEPSDPYDVFGDRNSQSPDSETMSSASSASIPSVSDDTMSTSSTSSDEIGKFFAGQRWRCEECNEVLTDCECPNGPAAQPCIDCGSLAADMEYCSMRCSLCHAGPGRVCNGCYYPQADASEDGEDELLSELVWDREDSLWRCALCQWEVEGNNPEEGQCHCLVDGNHTARRIDLAEYSDFEPADSDSSVADSTDSEPDSGDEEFIDDDGPFYPALAHLLASNYDPFEVMDPPEPDRMEIIENA